MSIQITTKEAHRQLDLAYGRFDRAMKRTAESPRDAGTLGEGEIQKAGVAAPYQVLDRIVFASSKRTADGQVGRDDIKEVISAMKGAVTKAAGNNLLAEREATTDGLKAVFHAARYNERASASVTQKS